MVRYICVYVVLYKNCFKIVCVFRVILGFFRKKIKIKILFLESFNLSKLFEGLIVEVFWLEMLVNEL